MIESTVTSEAEDNSFPRLMRDKRDGQIFIATRYDASMSLVFGAAVSKSSKGYQKGIGEEMSVNRADCEPFIGRVTLQNK